MGKAPQARRKNQNTLALIFGLTSQTVFVHFEISAVIKETIEPYLTEHSQVEIYQAPQASKVKFSLKIKHFFLPCVNKILELLLSVKALFGSTHGGMSFQKNLVTVEFDRSDLATISEILAFFQDLDLVNLKRDAKRFYDWNTICKAKEAADEWQDTAECSTLFSSDLRSWDSPNEGEKLTKRMAPSPSMSPFQTRSAVE